MFNEHNMEIDKDTIKRMAGGEKITDDKGYVLSIGSILRLDTFFHMFLSILSKKDDRVDFFCLQFGATSVFLVKCNYLFKEIHKTTWITLTDFGYYSPNYARY